MRIISLAFVALGSLGALVACGKNSAPAVADAAPAASSSSSAAAAAIDAGLDAPLDPPGRARAMAEKLGRHDYYGAEAGFGADFAQKLTVQRLALLWQEQTSKLGRFTKIGSVEAKPPKDFEVTMAFAEGTAVLQLRFDDAKEKVDRFSVTPSPKPYAPPAYVDATKFTATEVSLGEGPSALPGTLTMPTGKGPFRAVVIVPDAGEQDRDGSLGPSTPLRDLAEGLSSRNIAVLRFEKRTFGHRHLAAIGIRHEDLTLKEEYLDDVATALKLLEKTPGVDPKRVYLVGHGLGGGLTPKLAALHPEVAGLVLLAGNARPLPDIIVPEIEFLARGGHLGKQGEARLADEKAKAARAKDPALTESTPASQLPLGLGAKYWISMRGYDPVEQAKSLRQPMLVIQGGRDYQITQLDYETWKNGIDEKRLEARLFTSLNHAFFAGEGGLSPAEYEDLGHVALLVIDAVSDWIGHHP